MDLIFDMETGDPDDVFTLCVLATHPSVSLRAVTITPGSKEQVGLVRYVLDLLLGQAVPIGAKTPDHPKSCVSEFHRRWLGRGEPSFPDSLGGSLIKDMLSRYPGTIIVTGGPLGNIKSAIESGVTIPSIFIQGGFAGDSVVPPEHRMEKFLGRESFPTYNLNGDVPSAKLVLSSPQVTKRHLISKNVCHGVIYDQAMHERMLAVRNPTRGFTIMRDGMAHYLLNRPAGKAFHDPLAACTAIDPTVCQYREVEVYREKGEWGSRLKNETNTFISVACNKERFEQVLSQD